MQTSGQPVFLQVLCELLDETIQDIEHGDPEKNKGWDVVGINKELVNRAKTRAERILNLLKPGRESEATEQDDDGQSLVEELEALKASLVNGDGDARDAFVGFLLHYQRLVKELSE